MAVRARKQKRLRAETAKIISQKLAKVLASEEHQRRIHGTDRLFPRGSLKRQILRTMFGGWIKKYVGCGRIFTKTLAKDICGILREQFGMGTSPQDEWVHLQVLLSLARKRKLSKTRKVKVKKSVSAMGDCDDTLPLDAEDRSSEFVITDTV